MPISPVVEASELDRLTPFLLLDARDLAAFEAGHPPGAIQVPLSDWETAAKADTSTLEQTPYWQQAIRNLGLNDDTFAIVYDDGRMTDAARIWFILQFFGAKAGIINGGWPAIADRDVPASSHPAGNFHARPGAGPVGLALRETLKSEIGTATQIFDTRTAPEFAGEYLRRNKRGGHLPGARNLAHGDLLDRGFLRSPAALRALLSAAGFQPGIPIVTHCDGGGRGALAALAALRAGYQDVRAYYLSFADWASDDACPITRE